MLSLNTLRVGTTEFYTWRKPWGDHSHLARSSGRNHSHSTPRGWPSNPHLNSPSARKHTMLADAAPSAPGQPVLLGRAHSHCLVLSLPARHTQAVISTSHVYHRMTSDRVSFLGLWWQSTTNWVVKTMERNCLMILEAGSSEWECQQGCFLLRAVWEICSLCSSQLPAVPWQSLAFLGLYTFPSPSPGCMPASEIPLFIRMPVILDWGSALLHCDLILTNHSYNYPISK